MSQGTIRVRNWEKWQTYRRDRGQPPWIKVHRALMRDPNWVRLSDAERGQLVALWIIAADRDGELPDCGKLLRKLCYMEGEPDLQLFEQLGFLERDANMTPTWRQGDAPEAETEAEAETEVEAEQPREAREFSTSEETIGPDGSDLPHPGSRMSATELVHLWASHIQPTPTQADRARQKPAAMRITTHYSRDEVVQALVGMTALFPHAPPPKGKSEPWDLHDLSRKFAKARAKAMDHPGLKAQRFEDQFLEAAS